MNYKLNSKLAGTNNNRSVIIGGETLGIDHKYEVSVKVSAVF